MMSAALAAGLTVTALDNYSSLMTRRYTGCRVLRGGKGNRRQYMVAFAGTDDNAAVGGDFVVLDNIFAIYRHMSIEGSNMWLP